MPQPIDLKTFNILAAAVSRRDSDIVQMASDAIEERRVVLAFQPIVNATTNGVAFYEGLARVLEPNGRIIPAGDFMPAIDETLVGRQLDCRALDLGLTALRDVPGLRLAVNMSARSIGNPEWTELLESATQADETIAERLILEITESSAMAVPELVAQFMSTWRSKGVCFALDDFGAGQTAFRYFKQFQFDILKIDGQFSRNIADDPDNQVIAKALLSIAEHFDMITVAEHIETEADAQMLRALGAGYLQGYHFGIPTVTPEWDVQDDATTAV